MVRITIDGKTFEVKEGLTILEAARSNDINIPTLCYLKGVNEIGACKMCVVEVEGRYGGKYIFAEGCGIQKGGPAPSACPS